MRKLVVACAVIVLLTIVFVGAIQIYQQWGKSATRLTDENPAVLVNAELVSIVAGRDNTIFSESGKSAGAASTLFSGQNNSGSPRRALLWFNVAGSIPAGSTVHSAALILHLSRAAQTETMAREFAGHRLLSDWGGGTSGRGGPGHGRAVCLMHVGPDRADAEGVQILPLPTCGRRPTFPSVSRTPRCVVQRIRAPDSIQLERP